MVSFIILEFHSTQEVFKCIDSIKSHIKGIEYEIIISSNSLYPAEQQSQLSKTDPLYKWVFNTSNLGFAGGMNAGIRSIDKNSQHIIIMNQDVRISCDSFNGILEFMKNNSKVGMVGVKICDASGKIQDSFRKFYTPLSLVYRQLKRLFSQSTIQLEYKYSDQPIAVDWIIGAFMVISKDVINKIGLLDEDYFLYVEDMDWCYRIRKNGFQIFYYPAFKIEYEGDRKSLHIIGKTGKLNKYLWYHIRSYLLFLRKHRLFFKLKFE